MANSNQTCKAVCDALCCEAVNGNQTIGHCRKDVKIEMDVFCETPCAVNEPHMNLNLGGNLGTSKSLPSPKVVGMTFVFCKEGFNLFGPASSFLQVGHRNGMVQPSVCNVRNLFMLSAGQQLIQAVVRRLKCIQYSVGIQKCTPILEKFLMIARFYSDIVLGFDTHRGV